MPIRAFFDGIKFGLPLASASAPPFDSHGIKEVAKGGKAGKMKTGAKQLRGGNSQFRHFDWSNSGQIRTNPGKKINKSLVPPPFSPFAPVKRSQSVSIGVHPWFKVRIKIKITKRTHLSFFNLPMNKANSHTPSSSARKNEPISEFAMRPAAASYRRRLAAGLVPETSHLPGASYQIRTGSERIVGVGIRYQITQIL